MTSESFSRAQAHGIRGREKSHIANIPIKSAEPTRNFPWLCRISRLFRRSLRHFRHLRKGIRLGRGSFTAIRQQTFLSQPLLICAVPLLSASQLARFAVHLHRSHSIHSPLYLHFRPPVLSIPQPRSAHPHRLAARTQISCPLSGREPHLETQVGRANKVASCT